MSSIASRIVAVTACLLVVLPREAGAWSRDGHRIVCRIAWQLLDQSRRALIERLTSTYRDPDGQAVGSYYDGCAFADDARAKATTSPRWNRFAVLETWHFANLPRTSTRIPVPPCQVACVITAIPAHADSLRRATTDQSRAEALFFLSHWVGDVHQPLHVAYYDDRGGNQVRPIEGGYYSAANLHALWDGGLLRKLLGASDWQDFADRLAREITPAHRATWIQSSPVDWAQESYNLITSPRAKYCDWRDSGGAMACMAHPGGRTMDETYQSEFADDVALRLQQAGVRLAELITANLGSP